MHAYARWSFRAGAPKLVTCFRPFLEYLASSDLSPKTIQKHVDKYGDYEDQQRSFDSICRKLRRFLTATDR
jgi:hypothetical protein